MDFTNPARRLCLVAALSLFAQAAQAQRPDPARGRTAVEVGEVVTGANDFAEPTAAVIPPNTNRFCRQGRLFLASGFHAISLDLNATNAQPTAAPNLVAQAKPPRTPSPPRPSSTHTSSRGAAGSTTPSRASSGGTTSRPTRHGGSRRAASYTLYECAPGQPAKAFATVEAGHKGRSLIHGTFVEAEGEGAPTIFYWLEEVGDRRFQVRFRVYYDAKQVGPTHKVSTAFTTSSFTGDYMGGTSYRTSDGWEFFLSWDVCGNVKFVNVFLPLAPPKPDQPFASVAAKTKVNSPLRLRVTPGASGEVVKKVRSVDSTQPCQ